MAPGIPAGGITGLESGVPVIVASAITAAQTAAANQGPVGQASNPYFGIEPAPGGGDRTINFHARGGGGVLTAATITVYASDDGGATWTLYQVATALATGSVSTDWQMLHALPGLTYQALVTTLTLGGAASVSVSATVS